MNINYLLYEAAMHTYSVARIFDEAGKLRLCYRFNPDINDDALIEHLAVDFNKKRPSFEEPLIFSVNDRLVYSLIHTKADFVLLGPVILPQDTEGFLHRMSFPGPLTEEIYSQLSPCTLSILADDTVRIYNSQRTGEPGESFLSARKLIEMRCIPQEDTDDSMARLTSSLFDNVENSFVHNPYTHEKLEVAYVKNGNVSGLEKLLHERFPGRYGTLSKDPILQEKYLGIVAITIVCRAAIDAGVHPETAFMLSDISIQRVDECSDPNMIIKRTVEAELHFAELVRDLKKEDDTTSCGPDDNHHINKCKDYIFTHLHGKITVRDVADAIGLEPNYLSALFKRCENISLKNYITSEKIKLVKNLLVYSDYTFAEVSSYLGFSSQSHMGMEFKRYTGMTPREYRSRYANHDFISATAPAM